MVVVAVVVVVVVVVATGRRLPQPVNVVTAVLSHLGSAPGLEQPENQHGERDYKGKRSHKYKHGTRRVLGVDDFWVTLRVRQRNRYRLMTVNPV